MHEIIIVGGGIAGLYLGYLLGPDVDFVILEGSQRVGGRLFNMKFEGEMVVGGAGIGRKAKDHLLLKLLRELGVGFHEFQVEKLLGPLVEPIDLVGCIRRIRNSSVYKENPHQCFDKVARAVLGDRDYQLFKNNMGYTDYEATDAQDVIENYGIEDNIGGWTGLSIPWHFLVDKLVDKIGSQKIVTGCRVAELKAHTVISEDGRVFHGKQVVLATTIDTVCELLPNKRIYHDIVRQPFLRQYARFNKRSAAILKGLIPKTTVVLPPLQKIIPMNPEKGIYMVAYADNDYALQQPDYAHEIEKQFGLAEGTLKILKSKSLRFYWPSGTHAFGPLPKRFKDRVEFIAEAQRPRKGLWVIGEAVSLHQGWVEGALESVHSIFPQLRNE